MSDIQTYNNALEKSDKAICDALKRDIDSVMRDATSKLWHGHPVWFLDENPIVGYAKRKNDIQLLFWSGQSFDEPDLQVEGTFKASQVRYTNADQINRDDLKRWLEKARKIKWDYKNIVKRRGILERLK